VRYVRSSYKNIKTIIADITHGFNTQKRLNKPITHEDDLEIADKIESRVVGQIYRFHLTIAPDPGNEKIPRVIRNSGIINHVDILVESSIVTLTINIDTDRRITLQMIDQNSPIKLISGEKEHSGELLIRDND